MLLISDHEAVQVLKMADFIEAMERAFAEEARGIAVNRPRTRYKVTPSARLALAQRKMLTDRTWDRFMRTQFKAPGRS